MLLGSRWNSKTPVVRPPVKEINKITTLLRVQEDFIMFLLQIHALLLIALFIIQWTHALQTPTRQTTCSFLTRCRYHYKTTDTSSSLHQLGATLYDSRNNQNEYTSKERHDMESLIIALSYENNDQIRRDKVQEIFNIELSKPYPQHFTNLFNTVLIDVGDRVRLATINQLSEKNKNNNNNLNNNTSSSKTEETIQEQPEKAVGDVSDFLTKRKPATTITTTAETTTTTTTTTPSSSELQVWALIDMMIQSKTIVKKSNKTLGSEGSFG
jgi:hypothetical protein